MYVCMYTYIHTYLIFHSDEQLCLFHFLFLYVFRSSYNTKTYYTKTHYTQHTNVHVYKNILYKTKHTDIHEHLCVLYSMLLNDVSFILS